MKFAASVRHHLKHWYIKGHQRVRPPRRFLVVSYGRTGSSWLASLLHSNPQVHQISEVFNDKKIQRGELDGHDLLAEFKRGLQPFGLEKAVGAKFLYYQLDPEYSRHYRPLPTLRAVQRWILEDPSFYIIHLTRKNLLRTVVSKRLAAKTGRYHATTTSAKAGSPHGVQIELPPTDAIREMVAIRQAEEEARQWFKEHPVLEVTYEDLVDQTQEELARVAGFLGVAPQYGESSLRKMGTSLRGAISNYSDLESAFCGTEWASFLEPGTDR